MTDTDLPAKTPRGLGNRGRRYWRQMTRKYTLSDSELEILHEIARVLDTLDAMAGQIAAEGLTVVGSAGQPAPHPLLSAAEAARRSLVSLARRLDEPDDDDDDPTPAKRVHPATSAKARRAADSRWRAA